MPVRLRLSRQGRSHLAYYHIVAADARSPRDGRYIERVGTYDPNTQPARVVVDHNLAMKWLRFGAQPTDTVHSLLSRDGVMLKFHLLRKGQSVDEVKTAYAEWHKGRIAKLEAEVAKLEGKNKTKAERLLAEEKAKVDLFPIVELETLVANGSEGLPSVAKQHKHELVSAE
jgi:small subunit ribosomal protein S16